MSWSAPKAKKSFEVGNIINVGFVKGLEVVKRVATPGDFRPDFYVLWNSTTNVFYGFQPHQGGLVRCDNLAEALNCF